MQVLGDLISLPKEGNRLPLPWWHRAPLGLMTRTTVHLGMVQSAERQVPDLIASTTHPGNWKNMVRVIARRKDGPGVLAEATRCLPNTVNVALAETATVDAGQVHEVTLICEPIGGGTIRTKGLEQELRQKGLKVRVEPLFDEPPKLLWMDTGEVRHGHLEFRHSDWRQQLRLNSEKPSIDAVDLEKAVVSADTRQRILRFVFPRKPAITLHIDHRDQPGVLAQIADVIAEAELNILSALLRRGGAAPTKAILVVTCEPAAKSVIATAEKYRKMVQDGLHKLPADLSLGLLGEGHHGNVLYPKHPDDRIVRIPAVLRPFVDYVKMKYPSPLGKIFVSRRFLSTPRHDQILQAVDHVLAASSYERVEARGNAGKGDLILPLVIATMFVSDGGIVLVTDAGHDKEAFNLNLAHEFGYLAGQGKQPLLLIEKGQESSLAKFTNIQGLIRATFDRNDDPLDPKNPGSVAAHIKSYLDQLGGSGATAALV